MVATAGHPCCSCYVLKDCTQLVNPVTSTTRAPASEVPSGMRAINSQRKHAKGFKCRELVRRLLV